MSRFKRDCPPENWDSLNTHTIREEEVKAQHTRSGSPVHALYEVQGDDGKTLGYTSRRDMADTLGGRLSNSSTIVQHSLGRSLNLWAVYANDPTALDNTAMSQLVGYGSTRRMAEVLVLKLTPGSDRSHSLEVGAPLDKDTVYTTIKSLERAGIRWLQQEVPDSTNLQLDWVSNVMAGTVDWADRPLGIVMVGWLARPKGRVLKRQQQRTSNG